ncbi:hypothetical protein THRCLA_09278 [Thraustotheca clavata]|uniref:Trypsin-like peptidase domain-containing protein n=1 Tax=Thraustotheca clavata TaxID=74557 RepID=A0A1V9YXM1_9STRA|nr:hypothetical protein THRCLA_09278 [Thraustotheca clavata]
MMRRVLALTTHFRLPHEGMVEYEVLSRGSAIVGKRMVDKDPTRFHVLTCAHVACPWLFPSYYPNDWLQHVDERFIKYTVALHDLVSNDKVWEFQLENRVMLHSSRDFAVLELDANVNKQPDLDGCDLSALVAMETGLPLEYHGHIEPFSGVIQPLTVPGSFFWANPTTHQVFGKSEPVLEQGMCGGAVTSNDCVVGLIEGIVPEKEGASSAYKTLENAVAFVDLKEITQFVHDVEVFPAEVNTLFTNTLASME